MSNPVNFLTKGEQEMVVNAIKQAESKTSGEIRLHIESKCKIDVLDRAAEIFELLKMHETADRNGVLFYLATDDHKFAILGDSGINQRVPNDFWEQEKEILRNHFIAGEYAEGLEKAILLAGEKLQTFFPFEDKGDINELPDDISFG